VYKTEEEAVSL